MHSRMCCSRAKQEGHTEMHAPIIHVSEMEAIKIETAQIVECIIQHTHRHTNNNNCILGVMRDRCTPGALKLLKMLCSQKTLYICIWMHSHSLFACCFLSLYFHFSGDDDAVVHMQFLFNGPGSWTAAVLSDRNSKLTFVLYGCNALWST